MIHEDENLYDVVNCYFVDGVKKTEKFENLSSWSEVGQYAWCLDGEVSEPPDDKTEEEDCYTVVYTWAAWVNRSHDPMVTPDDPDCKFLHQKIYTQPEKIQNKWN
jgi:hypothetical protein